MIWTTVWVTVLSLIAWVVYTLWFHSPPTKEETTLLVGVCGLCVLVGKALWRRREEDRRREGVHR